MGNERGGSRAGGELPLEVLFGGQPPLTVGLLGVTFIVVIAMIDHLTGPEVSLAPFYLMPVLLVTWNCGRVWGIATGGLATIATQVADVYGGVRSFDVLVPSWNAVVWFAVFVFVAWLLATLKESVRRQGQRLVAQTERSQGLEEANEMKDTLLHAVSHDLKGPLAGILGAMQTIRRAGSLHLSEAEMEDLFVVIEQSGRKAARLVDDLLDLDRLGRGQLQPEREPTDVIVLARRAATEVPTIAGHPVRVDGDEVLVDVDAAKVERIVENLLGNAGRHTPIGTPIHVGVMARNDGVVLVVEDEGEGVDDDIKEEIFEPFRQGESARGGVGIGLSLVRRFAELHGGSAHVEDRAGGGARFVVTLPGEVTPSVAAPTLRAV